MHPLISSAQNPKVKHIIALEKARTRKEHDEFVFEGVKELSLAVEAGYAIQSVFFCPDIIAEAEVKRLVLNDELLIPMARSVFEKTAYRESTGGVITIAKQREHTLADIKLRSNPLLLIIESVEKPGNLGALLRTADAAALDAVIICDPHTDFYNPNVIRSSLGCVFTNQVASASSGETIQWLKERNVSIYCTYLQASHIYYKQDFSKACAIVMGSEATGLSDAWVRAADANIIIPMEGRIDSMNVSTAAAVVIFEAKRQRSAS